MAASSYLPLGFAPVWRVADGVVRPIRRAGHFASFCARIGAGISIVLAHYRKELLRVLMNVSWGNGSVVVGGGTAGVIIILGAAMGAIVGIEGFHAVDLLGLGPATGLISSFASTRELAPIMAALGFASQAGCRFTAELGAMRISEEIDAMETLAIKSVPYLVTTRLLASTLAILPLYLVCLGVNYLACQIVVGLSGGQAPGTYLHYFGLVLAPLDVAYSVLKTVVFVTIATTVQCYFGFYANGGPQGVGVAAGRAMRAAITTIIVVNMLMTMALWGVDSGGRFGG